MIGVSIIAIVLIVLWQKQGDIKNIKRMDNNPNCSIKSNEWHRMNKKE